MKSAISIFLLLFSWTLQAQDRSPWVENYNTTDMEAANNVVILKNGNLLFTTFKGAKGTSSAIPYNSFHTRFFMLDAQQKTVLLQKEFIKTGDVYPQTISNIYEEGDSLTLIGNGLHEGDSMPYVVFIKCDYSLNTGTVKTYPVYTYLRDKQYFSTTYAGGGSLFKIHPDGGYYGMAINFAYKYIPQIDEWLLDTPMTFTYFHLDNKGDLIAQGQTPTQYYIKENKRLDVIYNPTLKQYYTGDITGESYVLDSNLKVIRTTPDIYITLDTYHSSGEYGSSPIFKYKDRYVIASSHEQIQNLGGNHYFTRADVNFTQLDNNFNTVASKDVQLFTTDSLGGVLADFKAIDYSNEDSLFICTYVGFASGCPYRVALLDSNFNVLWSRLDSIPYLRDIQSIKVLPQGGFMIMGSTVEDHDFDMFIATYDKDMIRTGVRYFDKDLRQAQVYPNPGTNILDFKFDFISDYIFTLYDMQGRQLLQSSTSPVDVSALPAGAYFYTITDKFLSCKTGKWIKQ